MGIGPPLPRFGPQPKARNRCWEDQPTAPKCVVVPLKNRRVFPSKKGNKIRGGQNLWGTTLGNPKFPNLGPIQKEIILAPSSPGRTFPEPRPRFPRNRVNALFPIRGKGIRALETSERQRP